MQVLLQLGIKNANLTGIFKILAMSSAFVCELVIKLFAE